MLKYPSVLILILLPFFSLIAQNKEGKLILGKSKTISVTLDLTNTVTQEAMGKAIDFTAKGTANHSYQITDSTDIGYELHHEIQRFHFIIDGMGQKKSFDSDRKEDMNDAYGEYFKNLLSRSFDVNIDQSGKVISTIPEKIDHIAQDEQVAVVTRVLNDLTGVVDPPAKGSPIFFNLLPAHELTAGETWADSVITKTEKTKTSYKVADVTDTTIVIDFASYSNTNTVTELMGMQAMIKLNNISTGKISINKATNLLVSKTIHTESNGSTEMMGSVMPLRGKTEMVIAVREG